MQFPKGGEISFSEGKILRMNESQIFYTSSTEPGSSGSPLIIRKNVQKYYIIGIHVGANESKKCNFGSSFKPILEDIKNKNQNTKSSKSNESKAFISQSLLQNLDNYEMLKCIRNNSEVLYEKNGNKLYIIKSFFIYYYDNTKYPSLFEYYFSKEFQVDDSFSDIMKLKDYYYNLYLLNGGRNGFDIVMFESPLTIIIFKQDKK